MDPDPDEEMPEVAGASAAEADVVAEEGGKKKGASKKRRRAVDSDEEPGGDDSDEEASADDDSDEETAGKGKKTKAMPLKKRMAMEDEDSENEEDAALRAELGYGEDLYKDEEDKEQLEAMTEIEREMELFERAERRDELIRTMKLRQEQKERQEAAKPGASKPAARERRPAKEDKGKASALKELQARRAQKEKAAKKKKRQRAEEDGVEMSEDEASEEEEEEEEEEARGSDSEEEAAQGDADDEKEDPVMTIEMLQKVRVDRRMLERWHKEPFFDETIKGCYTRILIGVDPKTRDNVFRLAQIVSVAKDEYEGKQLAPYEFPLLPSVPGKPRSKGATTRKFLVLEIGKMKKVFSMQKVSNSTIPQSEFDYFVKKEHAAGGELPRQSQLNLIEEKLVAAEDYRYTATEVKKILEERREQGKAAPNLTFEKNRLLFERDKALEAGDDAEKVAALEEEISLLEEKLAEGRLGLGKLSNINKRNKNNNYQTTNKAGEEAARLARDPTLVKSKVDPFSRRPTQLSNYWSTKAEAADAAASEESPAEEAPVLKAETQQAKAAAETAASKASSGIRALTEAHKAVRLNVDLSLITDSSSSVAAGTTGKASLASLGKGRLPPGVTPFNVPQPYHVRLTLAEWRTRQGLDQEA